MPAPIKKKMGSRRSVSAEVYGEFNKKEDFEPRVIPKTEDQRERIKAKLEISFIFNGLDKSALEIVINAMEEKTFAKDEAVMTQGEEGNELFVVDSGTLSCTRKSVTNFHILGC